ncbi:hypothetical protein H4S02_003899, partial [Coemansia sp. RSA 2611]
FRILESAEGLRGPAGIVFVYGCFNVDVRAWMTRDETRVLLGQRGEVRDHLHHESPLAVTNRDAGRGRRPKYLDERVRVVSGAAGGPGYVPLTMTSSFTYFSDQVLTPEMMRAMVIMYVGPNARPDFRSDYYLSPVVAPPSLLARFPPTYFLCGEKDPMVDDTVLFAARIRRAKRHDDAGDDAIGEQRGSALYRRRHSQPRLRTAPTQFFVGSANASEDEDAKPQRLPQSLRMTQFKASDDPLIKVKLVAGMSHGFLQMYSLLPEARRVTDMVGEWLLELLDGSHSISPYSRCASAVDTSAANDGRSRSSSCSDFDPEPSSTVSVSVVDNVFDKHVVDRYGVEIVSAANMVHRRGHGLANPLS